MFAIKNNPVQLRANDSGGDMKDIHPNTLVENIKDTKGVSLTDLLGKGACDLTNYYTKEEVDELFEGTSTKDGKLLLEKAIINKGGNIVKQKEVPSFTELEAGINTISTEDMAAKQALLDVIIGKLPDLDGKLTLQSSLYEYAQWMFTIGPMNMGIRETLHIKPVKTHGVAKAMPSGVRVSVDPIFPKHLPNTMDTVLNIPGVLTKANTNRVVLFSMEAECAGELDVEI